MAKRTKQATGRTEAKQATGRARRPATGAKESARVTKRSTIASKRSATGSNPSATGSTRSTPVHGALTARLDEVAAGYCRGILSGGMARALGFEITQLTPKRITARMTLRPRHRNHNGRVNGGAIMAFADLLGALGAAMNRPANYRGGTLESKTNFFSAGTGESIEAVCVPLHVGRTTSVWQTTVKDGQGRTIAMVTQTQMALPIAGK